MSVILSEEKREPFEPAWHRAAREAEASDFLRDDDVTDDGGMEMLGRLLVVVIVCTAIGSALALIV